MFNSLWKERYFHAGPILEFKGSVRHVEKGHSTSVIQVDLIPKLMRILSIIDNRSKTGYAVAETFYCILLFYSVLQFLISSHRFLRISGNGRRKNLDNFYFFFLFLKKIRVMPLLKCKMYWKNKKNHMKGCLPWLGSRNLGS